MAKDWLPKPKRGQLCECESHEGPPSSAHLVPAYRNRERDGKLCFDWWCEDCQEDLEELGDDDETAYEEAIHCTAIPGLD